MIQKMSKCNFVWCLRILNFTLAFFLGECNFMSGNFVEGRRETQKLAAERFQMAFQTYEQVTSKFLCGVSPWGLRSQPCTVP